MRRILIVLAALAALPGTVLAEVELSAMLGYRGGNVSFLLEADAPTIACLVPPCVVAEARPPEGETFALVLDVPIASGWMFEALLNRQAGNLRLAAELSAEAGPLSPESFDLTMLQVGVQRRWGGDGLAPFIAGGLGVAHAETSARILTPPVGVGETGRRFGSEDVLSASFGVGARLALDSRWALRFEARGYWTDLSAEIGGELVQVEVSVGLGVRL